MDFESEHSWHALEADETKKCFHSDEQKGLTSDEVEKRRNVFGFPLRDVMIIGGVSSLVLWVEEIRKAIMRKSNDLRTLKARS